MSFKINYIMARLIIFQRNEILSKFQKIIRKVFGRYLFTQFFSYLNNKDVVSKKYYEICNKEYLFIKDALKGKKNILSIGGGMGGVESIILSNNDNISLHLIEKNFISKKIKYFWNPKEGYNKLNLTKEFIISNSLKTTNFEIFNFENLDKIKKKYDLIFSFYSMDYHFDLNIYKKFFLKNSHAGTTYIFDSIRPEKLSKYFKYVKVLSKDKKKIHSSSRVICSEILR